MVIIAGWDGHEQRLQLPSRSYRGSRPATHRHRARFVRSVGPSGASTPVARRGRPTLGSPAGQLDRRPSSLCPASEQDNSDRYARRLTWNVSSTVPFAVSDWPFVNVFALSFTVWARSNA